MATRTRVDDVIEWLNGIVVGRNPQWLGRVGIMGDSDPTGPRPFIRVSNRTSIQRNAVTSEQNRSAFMRTDFAITAGSSDDIVIDSLDFPEFNKDPIETTITASPASGSLADIDIALRAAIELAHPGLFEFDLVGSVLQVTSTVKGRPTQFTSSSTTVSIAVFREALEVLEIQRLSDDYDITIYAHQEHDTDELADDIIRRFLSVRKNQMLRDRGIYPLTFEPKTTTYNPYDKVEVETIFTLRAHSDNVFVDNELSIERYQAKGTVT